MDKLPRDLINEISKKLPFRSLTALRSTNKYFYNKLHNEYENRLNNVDWRITLHYSFCREMVTYKPIQAWVTIGSLNKARFSNSRMYSHEHCQSCRTLYYTRSDEYVIHYINMENTRDIYTTITEGKGGDTLRSLINNGVYQGYIVIDNEQLGFRSYAATLCLGNLDISKIKKHSIITIHGNLSRASYNEYISLQDMSNDSDSDNYDSDMDDMEEDDLGDYNLGLYRNGIFVG